MKKDKLPIWALVVMDLAAGAVCVGLVLLVLYVLPQGTTVSEQETQEATAQFALPSQGSGESAASAEGGLGIPAASQNNWSHADTISLAANQDEIQAFSQAKKTRKTLIDDKTDRAEIKIEQITCTADDQPIVYFSADVYVASTQYVKTAFAKSMYGKTFGILSVPWQSKIRHRWRFPAIPTARATACVSFATARYTAGIRALPMSACCFLTAR